MDFIYKIYYTFEYDPQKSLSNRQKHGIDFEQAKQLWNDPNLLVFSVRTEPEKRYLAIGKIADKHWSAVFTYRHDNIRLISVRRSRKKEVFYYEDYH